MTLIQLRLELVGKPSMRRIKMLFPDPTEIINKTETLYHLPFGSLSTSTRTGITAEARAIAMYVISELCPYSLCEIGSYFDREHTSVLKACQKIKQQIGVQPRVTKAVGLLLDINLYK